MSGAEDGDRSGAANPYAAPTADVNAPVVAVAGGLPLAGRGARLGAQLLDGLLYCAPAMLPSMGLVMMVDEHRVGGDPTPRPLARVLIVAGIVGFAALFLFQMYRLATAGQTLGKRWLDVRVVKQDDSPVTFSSAVLLRSIVPGLLMAVPYLGLVFWLVDTLFIFRDDRRCLHDLIAGTKVVEAPAP
jgi:uncharacterized RDD family membrane protein YckC